MVFIDGLPILADEIDILQEVRDQVLNQQGREILRKIKKSGNNIMVCCPNHNNGQERKPSCGISLVDGKESKAGTVHCFTCGYVDSFSGFISKCFGYEGEAFGRQWLLENFVSGELEDRPELPINVSRDTYIPQTDYITEQELASYRFIHPYMYQRKLTNEVIEKYDVGYQKDFRLPIIEHDKIVGYGEPIECLTFPVRDISGKTLFVSRRAIYNKNFFLPLDKEKPVYGIYELPKDCNEVVICESVINALTCVGYGIPAVALFGTGTSFQMEQLQHLGVRHFILGLDPDKAGNKGTWKLKKALKNFYITKLTIPQGKDINDLTKEEFLNLPQVYI